jgi:hypothetical protein
MTTSGFDLSSRFAKANLHQGVSRGGGHAICAKVKRVYIAGEAYSREVGDFRKKSARRAHDVRTEYAQTRSWYRRELFEATRGTTSYAVQPAKVPPTTQRIEEIVEVPERARKVRFHEGSLPFQYWRALQAEGLADGRATHAAIGVQYRDVVTRPTHCTSATFPASSG